MDCECEMMNGDMSPRLWICSTHGKTGMIGWSHACSKWVPIFWGRRGNKYAHKQRCDALWDMAFGFLAYKRVEAERLNEIYFCEDYFWGDLHQHFTSLTAQKPFSVEVKPKAEPVTKPKSFWKSIFKLT